MLDIYLEVKWIDRRRRIINMLFTQALTAELYFYVWFMINFIIWLMPCHVMLSILCYVILYYIPRPWRRSCAGLWPSRRRRPRAPGWRSVLRSRERSLYDIMTMMITCTYHYKYYTYINIYICIISLCLSLSLPINIYIYIYISKFGGCKRQDSLS